MRRRRVAEWLRDNGHDVLEVRTLGRDPWDKALLEFALSQDRVLITPDTDFGELIYLHDIPRCRVRWGRSAGHTSWPRSRGGEGRRGARLG